MKSLLAGLVGYVMAGCATAQAAPDFLTRNLELTSLVPPEALEGPGAWERGEWYAATGECVLVDSVGKAKGARTEAEWAKQDARSRLARLAAGEKDASFDPEMYELQADMRGVRVAATYHLKGKESLFLVALVRKADVEVKLLLLPDHSKKYAQDLYAAGSWRGAAKVFAALNAHGIEDPETMAWARAASARVNLEAGVTGESRLDALKTLAGFYEERRLWETCLQFYHQLYVQSDSPDRPLLEKLATLADLTGRPNNAEAFRREIEQKWHTPTPLSKP